EAIALYEKSLEKLRARLTDDHPSTLTAMRGLAKAYLRSGQTGRAVSLYETTLAKQRIKLGGDHPDTLLSLYELAKAHASAGQSEKATLAAREFIERAKKIEYRLPQDLKAAIPEAAKLMEISKNSQS
ncbi:MAG TPA: tetratricopeptide repeat protein, partial [Isosphaeraceae bacterium]|nr:tetratricopeptide repeat protein [Isosphaeraceae bacterium]